jgi:hypothetical protein
MKKLVVTLAALNLVACGGAQLDVEEQLQEVDTEILALTADEHGRIPGHYSSS